jgi:hypothetical protein
MKMLKEILRETLVHVVLVTHEIRFKIFLNADFINFELCHISGVHAYFLNE